MNTLVQIEPRSVFGTMRFYPINSVSIIFANMLGRLTLTKVDLTYIERLGYNIETINNVSWKD